MRIFLEHQQVARLLRAAAAGVVGLVVRGDAAAAATRWGRLERARCGGSRWTSRMILVVAARDGRRWSARLIARRRGRGRRSRRRSCCCGGCRGEPLLELDELLLAEVLGHLLGGKFCLTNVPEIFGQMKRLIFDERRQQRHIGRLPAARGQIEPDLFQLFAQLPSAVLALGATQHAAQQRRVQALGRRQTALNLANGHLVLGRRREQRQAARHRAERVGRGAARQRQHIGGARQAATRRRRMVMMMMMVSVVRRRGRRRGHRRGVVLRGVMRSRRRGRRVVLLLLATC